MVTNRGKYTIATTDLSAANLHVILLGTGATYNANTDVVADIESYELDEAGYSRQKLTGIAIGEDDTNGFAFLYADPAVFSDVAAGDSVAAAALVVVGANSSVSPVLSVYPISPEIPTNGGTVTINPAANNAGGWLKLS